MPCCTDNRVVLESDQFCGRDQCAGERILVDADKYNTLRPETQAFRRIARELSPRRTSTKHVWLPLDDLFDTCDGNKPHKDRALDEHGLGDKRRVYLTALFDNNRPPDVGPCQLVQLTIL